MTNSLNPDLIWVQTGCNGHRSAEDKELLYFLVQNCYMDEIVTDSLQIVYNGGCRPKQVCIHVQCMHRFRGKTLHLHLTSKQKNSYYSTKTYIMSTQNNRLNEYILKLMDKNVS